MDEDYEYNKLNWRIGGPTIPQQEIAGFRANEIYGSKNYFKMGEKIKACSIDDHQPCFESKERGNVCTRGHPVIYSPAKRRNLKPPAVNNSRRVHFSPRKDSEFSDLNSDFGDGIRNLANKITQTVYTPAFPVRPRMCNAAVNTEPAESVKNSDLPSLPSTKVWRHPNSLEPLDSSSVSEDSDVMDSQPVYTARVRFSDKQSRILDRMETFPSRANFHRLVTQDDLDFDAEVETTAFKRNKKVNRSCEKPYFPQQGEHPSLPEQEDVCTSLEIAAGLPAKDKKELALSWFEPFEDSSRPAKSPNVRRGNKVSQSSYWFADVPFAIDQTSATLRGRRPSATRTGESDAPASPESLETHKRQEEPIPSHSTYECERHSL